MISLDLKISPTFKRRLKPNEEADYLDTLNKAERIVCNEPQKNNMLIVPVTSLPQNDINNTGIGNLCSKESNNFFDFAKKYWNINEIQLLPTGQYHKINGQYHLYSGSSMDFGNHMIDIKSVVPEEDFKELVNSNNIRDRVNYHNISDTNSLQEKLLKKLFNNLSPHMQKDFENYKNINQERLQRKSLFSALSTLYGNTNYKNWNKIDSNLFDNRIITETERNKRIKEILTTNQADADFYIFKQFLAETHFKKAKSNLNNKGIKLYGDMPCGFSNDEKWANPKAFIKDSNIGWGVPAFDFTQPEAEKLLREKVHFYARNFDGFRVDAAWTYAEPTITNIKTNETKKCHYDDKILKIIDDEIKKVKGSNFDFNNITYEFIAVPEDFNIYDINGLKSYIKNRKSIQTSEHLSKNWGSTDFFLKEGWNQDKFVIGAANHDSKRIIFNKKQADVLSEILHIPKIKKYGEFLNAKFAETLKAKNTMFFFMNALGMQGQYKDNTDILQNYTAKIPANYEDFYQKSLQNKEAFNPMYAIEKQFISQGLDKKEPGLFKKIKKYRKILEQKEKSSSKTLIIIALSSITLITASLYVIFKNKNTSQHQ